MKKSSYFAQLRHHDLKIITQHRNSIKTNSVVWGNKQFDCDRAYWHKMLELEQHYGDINSMVFDLPVFVMDDMDQFIELWDRDAGDSYKVKPQEPEFVKPYADYYSNDLSFKGLDILDTGIQEPWHTRDWTIKTQDLRDQFPQFYQQLEDLLPFKKLEYVRLWQSMRDIVPHRDVSWQLNLPVEIRISLYDENPDPVFCVTPELAPDQASWIDLPSESNTFGFNNVRCLHHSVRVPQYRKILVLPWGQPDLNRLEKMIEKGLTRYPNLVSRSPQDPYLKFINR